MAAAALRAGYPALGENYAQELRDKAPQVAGAEWHFIGRLQSNKVRLISTVVAVWQSLDRASVIDAVAKRCPGASVMVQVDLAGLERGAETQRLRVGAHPGQRGFCRFAHHIAQLTGQAQADALAAGQRAGLDEEDVAAVTGVGEPHDHARLGGALRRLG